MRKTARLGIVLAAAAPALALLSGAGSRLGWWDFRAGFVLLKTAAWGGVLSFALCAAAFKARPRLALIGLALALPAFGLPLAHQLRAKRLPLIHDVSTDTQDPPAFQAVLARRQPRHNSAAYGGPALAAAQKSAYPDIAPKVIESLEEQAFERALQAAKDMGWEIVAADPAKGIIEATASTFFFGFKDDIVVRVRPEAGMSRVDVRSASRVGKSDVGANARRIRAYLNRLGR